VISIDLLRAQARAQHWAPEQAPGPHRTEALMLEAADELERLRSLLEERDRYIRFLEGPGFTGGGS
jgi:hypothetical protein